MAHEWFVKRADSEQGPLSAAQMKQLASSGQIVATDLVRRADMGDWKQAGSIKGLFSDSPGNQQHGEQEPPQNTPERSGDNSGVDVGVKAKEGAKALGNSALLAGQLAAKQTELTTIKQSTLNTEFVKLGTLLFDNVQPTEGLQGIYGEIQALNSSIESLHAQSKQTPAAESFADKAKAIGNKTVIATKLKVAERDRRKKLAQLGETAFRQGHVPENYSSEKNKIEDLLARVEVLQSEISDIKHQLSAQTAEVAKAGRNLLYSTAVVASSAIFCAPIGLFLIWRHPTWEKPTKLKWVGISLACFFGFMVLGGVQRSASLRELASADQLWDNGNQVEAIEKYRALTEESFLPSSNRPRVYRRVIEFDCEHDNLESANTLIERANRLGVELTLTNPQAKSLQESVAQAAATAPQPAGSTSTAGAPLSAELHDVAILTTSDIAGRNLWNSITPNRFHQMLEAKARETGKGNILPIRFTAPQHHDDYTGVTTLVQDFGGDFWCGYVIDHSSPSKSTIRLVKVSIGDSVIEP